ncbi:mitochondrial ribosomal protein L37-domain-containing protein [Boletus reticuloceps]|uniref:Large ribosomal subunit protein mL54 n=1 Tax=Boletus reticuloceps TaxID=495285 RepID=A0A8I2YD84_9AGAM|nr:mitochondrial ribosomal protein L37-domain-containing protein [Boletus reticuloceps]
MSLLAPARTTFRTTFSFWSARGYASTSSSEPSSSQPPKPASSEPSKTASSCPAGTIMTGLNYLKGEPPILAKPDEEYPAWLWELTKPRQLMDDGPGGKAEKRQLRLTHRQTLKDKNMFKTK